MAHMMYNQPRGMGSPASMHNRSGARRGLNGKPKVSMMERFGRIEANLLSNMEILQQHRQHTESIREERREQERQAALRAEQSSKQMKQSVIKVEDPVPGQIGVGNMKSRCAVLEEHLTANETLMKKHRSILDEAHEVKRQQAAAVGEVYDPTNASARTVNSFAVKENSQWMGPALQGAAYSMARADEAQEEMHRADKSVGDAAAKKTVTPASGRARRPLSALSTGSRASRPCSAGSMRARCKALEENVLANRETLASNRETINEVVKIKREIESRVQGVQLPSVK